MAHTVIQILNVGYIAELTRGDRTDGQLLDLFVRKRDEEAFAAVVRRHGPMVLGVCRRVLRNFADAEDAFQAAFLVLARKAASLGTRGLLAQWLHGVAYYTARRLRRTNARRAARERPLVEMPEPVANDGIDLNEELLAILDEELGRLPERYRAPIVLCDLEGTTRKEAARQLGCPEGTVAGRLARARALLAERLASRGFAPTAGVLAVLLTQRSASAIKPATVGNVTRAAFGGTVSARVMGLTLGVVTTMFLNKLKSLLLAMLLCGLAIAGLASAFRADVNAGTEPAAPPEEKSAKPADDVKVLTLITLKKLDAEATAKVIAEGFKGKGVTVAAIPDERSLLLCADAKATREVEELLVKLGEFTSKKPSIVRLKGTNCLEAAKTLQEVFNGPKANESSRVTIIAMPEENALLVFASPIDMLTIRKLVEKSIDATGVDTAKPAAAPQKTVSVNFKSAKWDDVLEWFSKESGLTPILTVKPIGTVTLQPAKERKFTIAEVVDLLNEALGQQKFILIRRQVSFYLHPADEKINPSWVPRIELSELEGLGKTELVQVLIPLKNLSSEDVVAEMKRQLTPFGQVSSLTKSNTLIILDTAGNVKRIYDILKLVEEHVSDEGITYICKFKKAQEVAEHLKKSLADTKLVKANAITVDERRNSITLTGTPDRIAAAKKIIEDFDKGTKPYTSSEPELRKYSVPAATADAIAKKLLEETPTLRIIAVNAANELWVMAAPEVHQALAVRIGSLAGTGQKNSDPKNEPEREIPKKFPFKFKDKPWEEVLEWYAKESGLTSIPFLKPKGTFTFVPPKEGTTYTLAEITDILNESLQEQKAILVRVPIKKFVVIAADERIDSSWIPCVELDQLDSLGKTEMVQVLIPMATVKPSDIEADIRKMLGRYGHVHAGDKTKTLFVLDNAENVRRILGTIRAAEKKNVENVFHVHQCKWKKADDIAEAVRTRFAEKPGVGGGDAKQGIRIVVERSSNSVILLSGTAEKLEQAKKLIVDLDKPKSPGDK